MFRLQHNHTHHDVLHPRIYQTVAALALWLVLSVWFFFSAGLYTPLTDAVVSGLVLVAVGLPLILSRVGSGLDREAHPDSLRDWFGGDFQVWGARLGAADAAAQVLLPIAAVSIGMTLFGLVFYFVR
jgi:hypothetical protein